MYQINAPPPLYVVGLVDPNLPDLLYGPFLIWKEGHSHITFSDSRFLLISNSLYGESPPDVPRLPKSRLYVFLAIISRLDVLPLFNWVCVFLGVCCIPPHPDADFAW